MTDTIITITINLSAVARFTADLLLFYLCIGLIPLTVYLFSCVVSDYGRVLRKLALIKVVRKSFLAWIFWPLSLGLIKRNLSHKGYNRPYHYYR